MSGCEEERVNMVGAREGRTGSSERATRRLS